ncbi:MAG TPA: presenilin family intramembrane aspartyl protease PSH [Methanothrix sp.]|nr:presenilin family intramembrane aspartyl protease PSH [Methanothrix sp.]HPJ84621.1 presenilin family intramembrane aspartyl protease PSH [Methanothrix sp.]
MPETLMERVRPMAVMISFVVAVQILSLALMPPLSKTEVRIFENPESVANPFSYIFLVLGFTLFILMAMKLKKGWVVSGVVLLAIAMGVYYVLSAFLPLLPALLLSLAILVLLHIYPEWYVIDLVGLLVCAGVGTLFGLSMTPFPALLLLLVLAAYDAISVYKTRHMVTLAEGVMEIRAPLLFVVPRRRGYSFRREGLGSGKDRGAYFLGLGDAIIPTVLVISANWSLALPVIEIFGIGANLPALGTMLGTYLGFAILSMTSRDKPQAGLPFLNGGAILGFLLAVLASGAAIF